MLLLWQRVAKLKTAGRNSNESSELSPSHKGEARMPHYHFNVKRREGTLLDPDGMNLPDEAAARGHALHVMSELMRNANVRTRAWRLTVIDENRGACFEFLFASYDDSMAHLTPELRTSVETICRRHALLTDAIVDVRTTMLQLKGTLARSDRRPYVAAENGRDCS
jgi:uncharacterized protein DUF6894